MKKTKEKKSYNLPAACSIITLLLAVLIISSAGDTPAEWAEHRLDKEGGHGADGVKLADVNGDGLLDIVSGWEQMGQARIYIHPGKEKVKEPWPSVIAGTNLGAPEDAVFCDLDNDAAMDVVTSSEGKGCAIYFSWAPKDPSKYLDPSAWTSEMLPESKNEKWMFSVPVDMDGKNGIDLVSAGKHSELVWFESPPDPRKIEDWKMHVINDQGGWTMSIIVEDMDGDGDKDILWTVRKDNPGIYWFKNPGNGEKQKKPWTRHVVDQEEKQFMFADYADLDGDGMKDIIAAVSRYSKIRFYRCLNRASTSWKEYDISGKKDNSTKGKGVRVADIDLDGKLDIAFTCEKGGNAWWLSYNKSVFDSRWTLHLIHKAGKLDRIEFYDADGDGDLDLFTSDEHGVQVLWYENPYR